jgi:hypothetical protein
MAAADVTMVSVGSSTSPGTTQPAPAQFDATQFIYPFQSLQSTPFTSIVPGAAVPPSVLNSHEADARANSERARCFWAHVLMSIFSILLIGVGGYYRPSTLPSALVALGTSMFALPLLWSLRRMANGCSCVPLEPQACIFGLNIVLMVFAVPTLGFYIWSTAESASFGHSTLLALSLTAALATLAIISCSILAMVKLSALQRICTENLRAPLNLPIIHETSSNVDSLNDGDTLERPLMVSRNSSPFSQLSAPPLN